MSRILMGVAGEGIGHAARSSIVANYLRQQGHTIKIISYHQGYWGLSDKFDTEKIFGLRFSHRNGETTYRHTVIDNLKKTSEAKESLKHINHIFKTFKPDLLITDLEPFSPIFANFYKVPIISIDNQHRITRGKVDFEKKWFIDYLINKVGVSTVAFNAQAYIITSFFKFKITQKNTYIVPPILSDKILQAKPTQGDYILVYNTTSEVGNILKLLKNRSEKFIIYGPNINKKINNCLFKKKSKTTFFNDLTSAKAIIASAGMTLISEALHLHKPYLAMPIKKRIEQLTNAYYLKKLGYGDYTEKITKEDIDFFLQNIPHFRKRLSNYPSQDNTQLYSLLDKLLNQLI